MNEHYCNLAYQKAIIAEARRYLIDTFIPDEGLAKASLVCDEVPYAKRVVTTDAIIDVIALFSEREEWINNELNSFEMRKKDHVSIGEARQAQEAVDRAGANSTASSEGTSLRAGLGQQRRRNSKVPKRG